MLQRRRGQRRNHPAVVREVRAGLGQPAAPAPGPGRATRGISMKSSSKINGTIHVLGRAVDQHGNVLDISGAVTPKRGGRHKVRPPTAHGTAVRGAAARHRQARQRPACPPRADALGEHRQSKYLNNRAENSHQPTRIRERAMKRFASPGQAQRFLFAFSHIRQHFRPRHLISAPQWRTEMTNRFAVWDEITVAAAASKTQSATTFRRTVHSHRLSHKYSQIT